MLAYLIVAALLPSMMLAHGIVPCGGGLPPPTGIRITGCAAAPCHVNRGGSITYQVDFTAPAASPTLALGIWSTVFGETSPINLPPDMANACNGLAVGSCPVAAGQSLTHGATIPVATELHDGVPVQLRFEISGGGNVAVCAIIDIVIH